MRRPGDDQCEGEARCCPTERSRTGRCRSRPWMRPRSASGTDSARRTPTASSYKADAVRAGSRNARPARAAPPASPLRRRTDAAGRLEAAREHPEHGRLAGAVGPGDQQAVARADARDRPRARRGDRSASASAHQRLVVAERVRAVRDTREAQHRLRLGTRRSRRSSSRPCALRTLRETERSSVACLKLRTNLSLSRGPWSA